MRYTIQLILVLFAVLCSANNLTLYNSNYRTLWPGHFTSKQPSGCVDPSDTWNKNAYIFFRSNNLDDAPFNFSISTRYIRFYPATLQHLLQASGFSVASKHSVDRSEYCGWRDEGAVKAKGITRGHISWKYNDLRIKRAPLNSGEKSMWYADQEAHVPPHVSQSPSNRTITFIVSLLLDNGPYTDIYFNWALCLAMLCIISTSYLLVDMVCKVARALRNRKMALMNKAENHDDIELTTINSHRASGLKSFESTRSEPLPLYSVVDAGR